jgi:arylsulfatase A-like enzyme
MRAITIMYDSLNRAFLPNYGDLETIAPNFKRLSEKMVTFDNFYGGSLPCIPARRELHTGRYNFMHRCWGPLEPYDDSAVQLLSDNGICTHIVTDHAHYWQEGGATFHTKFSSYEFIRGQEGDAWRGLAEGFTHNIDLERQDTVNRKNMPKEEDHYHVKTFEASMKFLDDNVDNDNWYLQIEYFDPHEPYFVPDKYKKLYTHGEPIDFDWPHYDEIKPGDENKVREARLNYRAVLSMCDNYLGKVLDFMDEHDMWKDTMLIINTDHGYLLGEHGYFGKNYMPNYDQIVHTPFFLWDPKIGVAGEHRDSLSQTIDIAPTLLDYFGVKKPVDMLGESLAPVLKDNAKIHEYILFGYFGKHVNITDGRYVYMRAGRSVADGLLNNYTLVPLHMFYPFTLTELRKADREMSNDFSFTKGAPIMKIPASGETAPNNTCYQFEDHMKYGDLLFDLKSDPNQDRPIKNSEVEKRLLKAMKDLMDENEAPKELYTRIGL